MPDHHRRLPPENDAKNRVPGGKIPYSISMKDDSPFVFAGLWEGLKDPANTQWLHAVRSSLANQMSSSVRSTRGCRSSFRKSIMRLGYPAKPEKRSGLYPANRMKALPISARVNSPKNSEITAPIELVSGRDLVSEPRLGTLLWWKTQAVPLPLAFLLAVIRKPKLNTLRKAPRPTNSISN